MIQETNMQQTLILIKPDGMHRRLAGKILARFEEKGLRIVGCKLMKTSQELASQHYLVHKGKPFYDSLINFITSGPTLAMVLEGREAVSVVRGMMGATDGAKSPPGTIR